MSERAIEVAGPPQIPEVLKTIRIAINLLDASRQGEESDARRRLADLEFDLGSGKGLDPKPYHARVADIDFADGSVIQAPNRNGVIHRRDAHGNLAESAAPGYENYEKLAAYFEEQSF